jgi:hypothetical protein
MGEKLQKLYDFAKANGGLPVQMRIAMKTGVPSANAASTPDTPELIAKAKEVIKEATGKDPNV